MKRMTADNVNVLRQRFLESSNFGGFARSLAANNCTLFRGFRVSVTRSYNGGVTQSHTWSIPRNNLADRRSFDVVDYVVGGSGDEMTVGKNLE
jgi:hypothetical protein